MGCIRTNCSCPPVSPGMLVLSSHRRLIGGNLMVRACNQVPIKSFQNSLPPKKAGLGRSWTYPSQLRLNVYDIQWIKN